MSTAPRMILVTRPQPEADRLCGLLKSLEFQAVSEPLLTIDYPACPPIEYQNIQGLITTSKNGLRALALSQYKTYFFDLPLFAVGKGTALLAQTQGFQKIFTGSGHAKDMIELIARHITNKQTPLLHLAGSVLAFDLKTALEEQGYAVIAPIMYHARPTEDFSKTIKTQLAMRQIDSAILMSPRMTAVFSKLIIHNNFEHLVRDIHFYCLSDSIVQSLFNFFPDIDLTYSIPNKPNQESLLICIQKHRIKNIN